MLQIIKFFTFNDGTVWLMAGCILISGRIDPIYLKTSIIAHHPVAIDDVQLYFYIYYFFLEIREIS